MTYPGLAEGEVVYAVGDIHGRADLLERMIDRIAADRAEHPGLRCTEIYLGDYIDRGPDSAEVIARLRRRMDEAELICLLGNHEAMLLDALDGKLPIEAWLYNGGDATLASYGIEPDEDGAYRQADLLDLPQDHLAFLRGLSLFVRRGPYFFVHAGLRPGLPLERQSPTDLVWIRHDFLDFDGPLGAVVVHGHTPVEEPEFRPNRIGIDTGAVRTGRLTCLRLDAAGAAIL
ncbi:metallophosphoesterase [Aureimonas endophytica]|uniref:Metallophosphoesterase n=1 Tax=Aureimonas endophytica TaxID=2027858 RepID=A0A916ZIG5_9HYPH|nr:metallophosphoesterase family protein [Aureimonas endophytica]GGD99481.1 metallophosphoesterase [Aureimonas endophytica]